MAFLMPKTSFCNFFNCILRKHKTLLQICRCFYLLYNHKFAFIPGLELGLFIGIAYADTD